MANDPAGWRVDPAALSRRPIPARDVGRSVAVEPACRAFQPVRQVPRVAPFPAIPRACRYPRRFYPCPPAQRAVGVQPDIRRLLANQFSRLGRADRPSVYLVLAERVAAPRQCAALRKRSLRRFFAHAEGLLHPASRKPAVRPTTHFLHEIEVSYDKY